MNDKHTITPACPRLAARGRRGALLFFLLGFLFLAASPCRAAVTITKVSDLDFGSSGVQNPVPTTGNNYLVLGTNGTMTYDTQYAADTDNVPNVAVITITSTTAISVDIACESNATFSTIGNTTAGTGTTALNLSNIQIDVNATSGPGAATACNGLTNFVKSNIAIAAGGTATVRIGARVDATSAKVAGTYTAAGYDIAVRNHSTQAAYTPKPSLSFSAAFQTAPVLGNISLMNWSVVTINSTPTSACHVDLGTNDTDNYYGCFSQGANALPASGVVSITGVPSGTSLSVYCDATAKLTNASNTASIQVTGIEIHSSALRTTYAGGNCAGQTTSIGVINFDSSTNHLFYLGGKLDGGTATGTLAGAFGCTNTGGDCPTVILTWP